MCKGGWQKSLIFDWGIVFADYNPSGCPLVSHLPLHKGGLEKIATRSGGDFIISNYPLMAAWVADSKSGKKKNKLGPVGATNNLRGLAAKTKFAL